MNICFLGDLHLPCNTRALQYDVLEWAIEDIRKKTPDCVVFVGDATCNGEEAPFDTFIHAVNRLKLPFLYIPGNSDLRCAETRNAIKRKASFCVNRIGDVTVYAINDCDGTVSSEQLALMERADEESIIFMHHPPQAHDNESVERLLDWRTRHPNTMWFYGHLHYFMADNCSVSLPALDPDKSIGEEPSIVYYETRTRELCKSHYPVSMPNDLPDFFGISCYKPLEQIQFATERHLKCLELRPNSVGVERRELIAKIAQWRAAGGENLSVHMPDVGYSDGDVTWDAQYEEMLELVSLLKADRITQHVPKVSVNTVELGNHVLEDICEALATRFNRISHGITIGVENMHMTAKDTADGTRRFGYTPEECIRFMQLLRECCRHKVGINFDIGHARNNAPYSKTYQIGTWFAMLGNDIVGYHLHQVIHENGKFENHMPITRIYGSLISLASFLKCWEAETINRVPIVFEMRPKDAYEKTFTTFEAFRSAKKEL